MTISEIDDADFTFFVEVRKTGINWIVLFLWSIRAVSFFQNPPLDHESNPYQPSKTVKRMGIRFEIIQYLLFG
jgi:hypothetical protein